MLGEHVLQSEIAAGASGLRVGDRVKGGRVGDHPGQQGRLPWLQDRRAGRAVHRGGRIPAARDVAVAGCRLIKAVDLAEVHASGRLNSVGAAAEVDRVQVLGEDLALGPLVGEMEGQRRLAELLENRPVALLRQRVLDELLSDRRSALGRATGDVAEQSAPDAADVDSGVAPEALVLQGHDRVAHDRRDRGEAVDDVVVGRREDADRPPAVVIQVGVDLVLILLAVLDLRQIGGDRHHHPEHRRDEGERAEPDQDREQPQLAHPRPRRTAAAVPPPATAWGSKRDGSRGARARRLGVVVFAHANGCDSEAGRGGIAGSESGRRRHLACVRTRPPGRRRESSIGPDAD